MTAFSAKPGFALPAVLFIALLGLLLGFGRLLIFKNQCRLRIDRQQQYEKVFAVRSALNRLQNTPSMFPEEGEPDDLIALRSDSGREVKVLIHPADAIFPIENNVEHFYVNRKNKTQIDGTKYRYVSSVSGDHEFKRDNMNKYICLMPTNAVPGDKCRLSLDMSDTGRWSDDPFGRRYAFNIFSLCGGTNEHDLVRLILRRKRQGEDFNGCVGSIDKTDANWLPRQKNESVIYAELRTGGAGGAFTAWTRSCDGAEVLPPVECVPYVVKDIASDEGIAGQNSFGIQLVGRQLSLFLASSPFGQRFMRYDLVGSGQISESVYFDFTNDMKMVEAEGPALLPDLVMELELEASSLRASASRDQFFGTSGNAQNQFNHFEVYPAFEFAIYIENKAERLRVDVPTEPKLATVVHLVGEVRNPQWSAITYDTHGTEIKGWRTDERRSWGLLR